MKKTFLRFLPLGAGVFAMLLAVGALHAQDWAKARLEASPRHREYVTLKHGDRKLQAYVAYPEVKGKASVVIMIHEIFGLSDWAKEMADELAGEGFIVVAPDLLSGFGPGGGGSSEFAGQDAVMKAVSGLDPAVVLADLDAAADYGKNIAGGEWEDRGGGILLGRGEVVCLCGAQEGSVGGVRVLWPGAGGCFDDYCAGVWVLRGERRADWGDGSGNDRGNEGCREVL